MENNVIKTLLIYFTSYNQMLMIGVWNYNKYKHTQKIYTAIRKIFGISFVNKMR